MKVKDLTINSWCPFCGKPKTCSFAINTLLDDDPDAVELPEMCACTTQLVNAVPGIQSFVSAAVAQVNLSEVHQQRERETLWEIARQVAEEACKIGSDLLCPFCQQQWIHNADCIVAKSRELMKWHKTGGGEA